MTTLHMTQTFAQDQAFIKIKDLIKKNVSSVAGYRFDIEGEKQCRYGFKSLNVELGMSGNVLNFESYNMKGVVIEKCFFDSLNNLVEQRHYLDDGKLEYIFLYDYSISNELELKSMYVNGEVINKTIYYRNNNNNMLFATAKVFDKKDNLLRSESYHYDLNGNLIKIDMGKKGTWYFEYDKNNNLIKKMGELSSDSKNGNVIELYYDNDGLLRQCYNLFNYNKIYEYSYFSSSIQKQ